MVAQLRSPNPMSNVSTAGHAGSVMGESLEGRLQDFERTVAPPNSSTPSAIGAAAHATEYPHEMRQYPGFGKIDTTGGTTAVLVPVGQMCWQQWQGDKHEYFIIPGKHRPKGWVKHTYPCACCGYDKAYPKYKYCPNCGILLEGVASPQWGPSVPNEAPPTAAASAGQDANAEPTAPRQHEEQDEPTQYQALPESGPRGVSGPNTSNVGVIEIMDDTSVARAERFKSEHPHSVKVETNEDDQALVDALVDAAVQPYV